MAKHGAAAVHVAARESTPAVRYVLADLRALARARLAEAGRVASSVDPALLPAFLPTAMVETYLDRMERPGFDPLRETADVSPLRRQWTLWRAARKGRL
jgi:phytoene synthase